MKKTIFSILILSQFFFVNCSVTRLSQKKAVQQKSVAKTDSSVSEQNKIEFEFYFIEGLKQKMLGNPDNAVQYFNNCHDIDPKSAAVLYELANIHVMKGDFTSAKPLLVEAINLNPDNKWYQLLLAQIYQNNKQYSEASKIYSTLIKANPDNLDYYYMNVLALSSAKKYDEAIKAYQQIEDKFGFNEQVCLARQQLLRTAGKKKEAYQEIEKLIKHDPSVPEYYGLMADMYKEDGDTTKALEYYNKVLEIDPDNGFVQFSLATFYIQNKNLEKGFQHAQKGFASSDVEVNTKIQFYLMLVSAPADQKLSDEQIEELIRLLIKANPDDSKAYSIQADFYIQKGQIQEARDFISKSLSIDPNSYSLWEQLVLIDNQLNDVDNMKKDSEKAIELFPTQPLLYVLNSISLIQLKDYTKALQMLDTGQGYVVDNNKLEAQFELYRAEAYYNLNDTTKAFASFEKVIDMEPDNYVALNNYAYYLSLNGSQLEKAESLSNKVITANPDNATYLDTYAWVLFKEKEYRLAKHYMEIALQNGGDTSDVIVEHYGDILFMLNDVENAVANWIKSKEMGNESKILQQKIDEKRFIEGDE